MRKGINIENMGGRDQSQIEKIKFEKIKSVPKTYQKVITMTAVSFDTFADLGKSLFYVRY